MNRKLLLFAAFAGIGFSSAAQTFSSTLLTSDPTFNRPEAGTPPTTLSLLATGVYYRVMTAPISIAGTYTFTASSVYDNFGILYSPSGFNPASPLDNAITAVDDDVSSDFAITESLAVGTYTLVFTTFADGDEGAFSITITGPSSVPLPLNLLAFNVRKQSESTASVVWKTANEKDVDRFEIQRSLDGIHYENIAEVKAKNNNTAAQADYELPNVELNNGKNIFRLKMLDINGTSTYSNVSVITNAQEDYTTLYPNPAGQTIFFSFNAKTSKNVQIKILDLMGREVFAEQYQMNQGTNAIPLNIAHLPAAKYQLLWSTEDNHTGVMSINKQ